jgi:hypothetical protein
VGRKRVTLGSESRRKKEGTGGRLTQMDPDFLPILVVVPRSHLYSRQSYLILSSPSFPRISISQILQFSRSTKHPRCLPSTPTSRAVHHREIWRPYQTSRPGNPP